jgi:hypothetical protein
MKTPFEELRDNLGNILGIDFSDIETGYNKIEQRICSDLNFDELTEKQWHAILEHKYDDLFQNGTPHISWNTDRSSIFATIHNCFKAYTGDSWDETWVHVTSLYYKFKSGVVLNLKREEPIVWGSGNTRYRISIVDETNIPKVNTHTAVIMAVNDVYGKVSIVEQHTGTEDEVSDWLLQKGRKYNGKNYFTKIIKFAE